MSEKSILMGLLVIMGVLLFVDMPGSTLFDPDETRYAAISREMIASGDFLTPNLNGSHYFEKPPLAYWLNAGSMAFFGQNTFSARLAVRLATIGILLMLIIFLKSSQVPNAGLWAGLVYMTSPLPFALGRLVLTDGILAFALTLAFFSLWGVLHRLEEGKRPGLYQIGLGVGVAMSFMAKGLIGVVLPGLVLFLWCAVLGRWSYLKRLVSPVTMGIIIVLTAPWFILMEKVHPGFVYFFFYKEHFLRYTTSYADRSGALFYFPLAFVGGFLPWILFFGRSMKDWFSIRREDWLAHSEELFLFLWLIVIIFFFSFSHSKLIPYILPAYPAAAALLGKWLASSTRPSLKLWGVQAFILTTAGVVCFIGAFTARIIIQQNLMMHAIFIGLILLTAAWGSFYLAKKRIQTFTFHSFCWAGIYFVLILTGPRLSNYYSDANLANASAKAGGDTIVFYECFSNGFPWVLKRSGIPVANYSGELASDGIKKPELFWARDVFWRRWNSQEKLIVYTQQGAFAQFRNAQIKSPFLVAENHRSIVVANFQTEDSGNKEVK